MIRLHKYMKFEFEISMRNDTRFTVLNIIYHTINIILYTLGIRLNSVLR